jgi:flagellar assembly protein FliH
LSEAAVSYDFEPLEPSEPPPRDAHERLLVQARAEADEIREQARRAGHAEGRDAGVRESAEEVRGAVASMAHALAELQALRDEVAQDVERDAIELGLALAGKIVAAALEVRPELVAEVVQGALRRVNGQRTVAVFVNPADLETVRDALAGAGAAAPAELGDLQADQRVERGGAIVRTAEGEVDVRVQTQLERAREVALAELDGGGRGA